MKKFVFEVYKGSTQIFSGHVDEPITMRIVEQDHVQLEMTLRSPNSESQYPFGRQSGDDFTMPFPFEGTSSQTEPHADRRPYDLNQAQFVSQPLHDLGASEDMSSFADAEDSSSSLLFEDAVLQEENLLSLSFDSLDMFSTAEDDNPPDLPDLPQLERVDIAVLAENNGSWNCIQRLGANDEYHFHKMRIWVDERASLLLTGSEEVLILVRHEGGQEEEFDGLNGSLELPPRATVLVQRGREQICFRPE